MDISTILVDPIAKVDGLLSQIIRIGNQIDRAYDPGYLIEVSPISPPIDQCRGLITSCSNLLRNFPREVFKVMPRKMLESVSENLSAFVEIIKEIEAQHDVDVSTLEILSESYSFIFEQLGPYSPLTIAQFTHSMSQNTAKIADQLGDIESKVGKVDKTKAEIDAALKAQREAAGAAGVATSAGYFGKSASNHTAAGYLWLVLVFAILIGAVLVVANNLGGLIQDGKPIWDNSALLLSLLMALLALTFASKAYRFNKHNQVVNEHRQNALQVFQAINAAAGDDRELKAIVLTAAANCMFSPQDSGYAKNAPNAEQPVGVVDMLARIIHK